MYLVPYHACKIEIFAKIINPLLHNVEKWSNILQKYCGEYRKIFKVCLAIFQHYEVKG